MWPVVVIHIWMTQFELSSPQLFLNSRLYSPACSFQWHWAHQLGVKETPKHRGLSKNRNSCCHTWQSRGRWVRLIGQCQASQTLSLCLPCFQSQGHLMVQDGCWNHSLHSLSNQQERRREEEGYVHVFRNTSQQLSHPSWWQIFSQCLVTWDGNLPPGGRPHSQYSKVEEKSSELWGEEGWSQQTCSNLSLLPPSSTVSL